MSIFDQCLNKPPSNSHYHLNGMQDASPGNHKCILQIFLVFNYLASYYNALPNLSKPGYILESYYVILLIVSYLLRFSLDPPINCLRRTEIWMYPLATMNVCNKLYDHEYFYIILWNVF